MTWNKSAPSNRKGTVECFQHRTLCGINQRTVNGSNPTRNIWTNSWLDKGVKLLFSKDEYYSWCSRNSEKILDLYRIGETAFIDRIDPKSHYSINNIRVISWEENQRLAVVNTVISKRIRVVSTNIKTSEKRYFDSMAEAKKLGFSVCKISEVVSGKRPHHKGFRWSRA